MKPRTQPEPINDNTIPKVMECSCGSTEFCMSGMAGMVFIACAVCGEDAGSIDMNEPH